MLCQLAPHSIARPEEDAAAVGWVREQAKGRVGERADRLAVRVAGEERGGRRPA